mmetsp:Transcript_7348/g.10000  ORF Transcript_7348/g.10000 Transcript_7348/m.10000 type:complete len:252 (-) Transcript_7348:61-816(-)
MRRDKHLHAQQHLEPTPQEKQSEAQSNAKIIFFRPRQEMMINTNAASLCVLIATFVTFSFHVSSLIHCSPTQQRHFAPTTRGLHSTAWKISTSKEMQQQLTAKAHSDDKNDIGMNAVDNDIVQNTNKRRAFLTTALTTLPLLLSSPQASQARYILNDEGEYEEVQDVDWQTAWKGRLDKAQSMSSQDIFMAARGAGNTELRDIPESDSSKKRRALSGCREGSLRKKAGVSSEKECTARVLGGDLNFMLDVM